MAQVVSRPRVFAHPDRPNNVGQNPSSPVVFAHPDRPNVIAALNAPGMRFNPMPTGATLAQAYKSLNSIGFTPTYHFGVQGNINPSGGSFWNSPTGKILQGTALGSAAKGVSDLIGGHGSSKDLLSNPVVQLPGLQGAKAEQQVLNALNSQAGHKAAQVAKQAAPSIGKAVQRGLTGSTFVGTSGIGSAGVGGTPATVSPKVPASVAQAAGGAAQAIASAPSNIPKSITSPAVKALNLTSRPNYAIAGATDALLHNKDVGKAFVQGITGQKKLTFSDVLARQGVKNPVLRYGGGLLLDIGTDPQTYAAPELGVPEKFANLGERALLEHGGEAAVSKATTRGIKMGARAHIPFTNLTFEAKTSGRATAAANRAVQKTIARTAPGRAAKAVKGAATEAFLPSAAPPGVEQAWHDAARGLSRQLRTSEGDSGRAAADAHLGLKRALKETPGPDNGSDIIKAIESGTVHELPKERQGIAKSVQELFHSIYHEEVQAGVRPASFKFSPQHAEDAQGYIPHMHKANFEARQGQAAYGGTLRPKANMGREIRKPLHVLEAEGNNPFVNDLPTLVLAKQAQTARRVHLGNMWHNMAAMGKPVEIGKPLQFNPDTHGLYEVNETGLHPVEHKVGNNVVGPDQKVIDQIQHGTAKGNYVVLPKHIYEHVNQEVGRQLGVDATTRQKLGRAYDKLQGGMKTVMTVPLPSYHARNLMGDIFMGFEGDMTARNLARSAHIQLGAKRLAIKARKAPEAWTTAPGEARTDKTFVRAEKAANKSLNFRGKRELAGGRIVVPGKVEKSTVGKELKAAEAHGATDTGFVGGEIPQLLQGKTGKRGNPLTPLRRASEYRENIPRFGTYLSARNRGMTQAQAAEHSLKTHIDYGELTPFERNTARRLIPFYTFFARNTGIQLKTLLTRPGKIASLAKVFDTSAKAAGFPSYMDYIASLPDYQQRGLPFPIKRGGKVYSEFLSLPATDLNQATINPVDQLQNITNRLTPLIKTPLEISLPKGGYSAFFGRKIEDPRHPRVPGPDLGGAPDFIKHALGVGPVLDKQQGKFVPGWSGTTDYLARQLPETNLITGLLTSGKGSRGQTAAQQMLAFGTGVKSVESNPLDNAVNALSQKRSSIGDKLAALRSQGVHGGPQYKKLLDQYNQMGHQLNALSRQRHDVVELGQAPAKGTRDSLGIKNPKPSTSIGGVRGAFNTAVGSQFPFGLRTPQEQLKSQSQIAGLVGQKWQAKRGLTYFTRVKGKGWVPGDPTKDATGKWLRPATDSKGRTVPARDSKGAVAKPAGGFAGGVPGLSSLEEQGLNKYLGAHNLPALPAHNKPTPLPEHPLTAAAAKLGLILIPKPVPGMHRVGRSTRGGAHRVHATRGSGGAGGISGPTQIGMPRGLGSSSSHAPNPLGTSSGTSLKSLLGSTATPTSAPTGIKALMPTHSVKGLTAASTLPKPPRIPSAPKAARRRAKAKV